MASKNFLKRSVSNLTAQNQNLDKRLAKVKKGFDEVSSIINKEKKKEKKKNGS